MDTDFTSVKPIWYIDIDTLVTILQVIKNLDENLKRKIVKIITLKNKKDEERYIIISLIPLTITYQNKNELKRNL